MSRVGVLALQGGFASHATHLRDLGHTVVHVRTADDLCDLEGICLPGGESTTQYKLIERWKLTAPLTQFIQSGKPVLATCAGLILAASKVLEPEQKSYGWLDLTVRRNAWGRQLDSFEACADGTDLPLVFIRAPRIEAVGSTVEIVYRFEGEPIMVRAGNIYGATFHPELTADTRIHQEIFGRG